jgi:drug/metabolite transporter (DMT)-like permease
MNASSPIAGSLLALSASLLWTLAPFLFASAVRSLGAYRVNPLRLAGASIMLLGMAAVYALFHPEILRSLTVPSAVWLSVSGITGLVVGDAFYLTSLGYLGPRRTLMILVMAPVISVLVAWAWLGETISLRGIAGMALTLSALFAATMREQRAGSSDEPGAFSLKGLGIAILAVLFHGSAAVLARKAYLSNASLDPALATAVRVCASALAIWIVAAVRGQIPSIVSGLTDRHALVRLGQATMLGPVLGMICYVSAFKTAPAGIVSLLSSLSPVLIIPITAWRYKARLKVYALVCMALAIAGVCLIMVR